MIQRVMIQKVGTMTRKSTAVFVSLAALTLAGFFVVSNIITGVITGQKHPDKALAPNSTPTATPKPQASASPQSIIGKAPTSEAQLRADLVQAQAALDQLNADIAAGAWDKANGHFAEFDQKTRL